MKRRIFPWVHVGLFVLASVLSLVALSKHEEPSEGREVAAELWPGRPEDVTSVSYDSDERTVRVVAEHDNYGRYYVVTVHRSPKQSDADAGVSRAEPPEDRQFVSVDAAKSVVDEVAPMKSYRNIGRIDAKRAPEFGLDKPDAHITVVVGKKSHRLTLGSVTPGSGDYYARDDATGLVHAISAELVNRLKYAESRMPERALHDFEEQEANRVRISAGGKVRQLVRIEDKSGAWAELATPQQLDETAGNWLAKVARLRPSIWHQEPGDIGSPLFRIDYSDKNKPLGFVELYRTSPKDKKYLARSELSRWYVEVPKSLGEQIEQDLGAVVK